MKIGIVGAGYWGGNMVRSFCEIIGDENVVVCDLDKKILAKRKRSFPAIKTTQDLSKLLKQEDVTAVDIATPTDTHYNLAKQALQAGKHTLVEKPLASIPRQAEELVKLAKENLLVLMVDHLLLFHPAVEKIKQLMEGKEHGKTYYIYSQRLNLGIVRENENALSSLSPHDISVFLHLVESMPTLVSAHGDIHLQKDKQIEDVAFLHMQFANGINAHAHLSWLDPHKVRKLTVVGSKKMFVFDDMEQRNKLQIYNKSAKQKANGRGFDVRYGDVVFPSLKLEEPLQKMCRHFIDCVKTNKQPLSDGTSGLEVVKIIEAAQKSLKNNGKPIKLNL